MPIWRMLTILAAVAGYALLSHQLMVHWAAQPWAVALLFGPLLGGLACTAWVHRNLAGLVGCVLVGLLLAWIVANGGVHIQLSYVLQHAAIHAVMAWTFGISLRRGAKPLITAVAERVHERFAPGQRAYTRRLTAVWAGYFVAMIVVSLGIYLLAPWPVWSLFCNVLTPLSVLALFVIEHVYRMLRHPGFERVNPGSVVRAYRAQQAAQPHR